MTTIYFLHVLLAFTAIAFLIVPGWMLEMAAHTRDGIFIRRAYRLGQRLALDLHHLAHGRQTVLN